MKLYCLLCRKESDASEYESCPHCGAMGKWAHPVEDSGKTSDSPRSPRLSNDPVKIAKLFEALGRYGAIRRVYARKA